MGRWFGSSGIRGPYRGTETPGLAFRLGRLAGATGTRVLVGHDVRTTGPMLLSAFAAGALSSGAAVTTAGPAATPSLAYAARDHDLALAVTASHNPPADNGFKFWNPDGSAWAEAQELELEGRLEGESDPPRPPWEQLRPLQLDPEVSRRHAEAIHRFAGGIDGPVVLDCGNGAGCYVTPALLERLGAKPRVLFGTPDGRFPNRPSEPTEENLPALRDACRRDASWGVAHDGDADRMVAVDPTGSMVPPDVVLVALALLRGARRLVVPVDASLALADALPEAEIRLCRVGDAAVSATLRQTSGDLGGETSGTYVVPAFDYAPDGPLAAILLLQAARGGLVEEARRRFKPTVRRSAKVPLGGLARSEFAARLAQVEPDRGQRATRVDGLRVDGDDGWTLIRPSGTEPVVRVTAEAWNAADADAWVGRGLRLAKTALA